MGNDSSPSSPPSPTTLSTHLKAMIPLSKIKEAIVDFSINVMKIARDDPRRMTHSLKVALAITLVSMVYYLKPFYKGIGEAGIWAILTVVVVFEYTVGEQFIPRIHINFEPEYKCILAYCITHEIREHVHAYLKVLNNIFLVKSITSKHLYMGTNY